MARVHDGVEVPEDESCVLVRPVLEDVLHYVAVTPTPQQKGTIIINNYFRGFRSINMSDHSSLKIASSIMHKQKL